MQGGFLDQVLSSKCSSTVLKALCTSYSQRGKVARKSRHCLDGPDNGTGVRQARIDQQNGHREIYHDVPRSRPSQSFIFHLYQERAGKKLACRFLRNLQHICINYLNAAIYSSRWGDILKWNTFETVHRWSFIFGKYAFCEEKLEHECRCEKQQCIYMPSS